MKNTSEFDPRDVALANVLMEPWWIETVRVLVTPVLRWFRGPLA